jgi:hypothetical protein
MVQHALITAQKIITDEASLEPRSESLWNSDRVKKKAKTCWSKQAVIVFLILNIYKKIY